jgi:alanine-synthesizing transaminase
MPGFWDDQDLSPNAIELARRVAMQRDDYIDLASSNPTHQGLLFPPTILQAGADRYWWHRRYDPDPLGAPAAREAIAAYYAARIPPIELDANSIFVTASTSEAYSLLFALLCEPGDNVLGPDVTYPLFEFLAAIHHVELRPYRLIEAERWAIDEVSMQAVADERTRAVLLISPHNPTGKVIDRPLAVLHDLDLPVICDEVFAPFTYRVPQVPPLGALHPGLPVFHLNGISKMFGLPDLKLGWAALNSRAHQRYGERLQLLNDTFLGANSLTQHMLPTLFADGGAFVEQMRERVRQNLDFALERMATNDRLRVQAPDGGYYLFPEVIRGEDEEELVLRLLHAGLSVHPGYFYGYERGTHLMISALTTPQQFRVGIDRLLRLV